MRAWLRRRRVLTPQRGRGLLWRTRRAPVCVMQRSMVIGEGGSGARTRGRRARRPAACSSELRVQRGMLKALLVIAHYTPGEPACADGALQG